MRTRPMHVLLLAASLLAIPVAAQARHIAFVGCPVYRDMPLPQISCWLASDGEDLYFLGQPTSTIPPVPFYSPQLKHRVLVEGDLVEGKEVCGGMALENVKTSVFPEIDESCQTVLPSAGFTAPKPPRVDPPFRQGMGLATGPAPDYAYMLPGRPPLPDPPFKPRSYRIDFAFNEDFVHVDDGLVAVQALYYFQGTDAKKIAVDVYRDSIRLTGGTLLPEDPEVVARRASRMQSILQDWDVPADRIEVRQHGEPVEGGRYLELSVVP